MILGAGLLLMAGIAQAQTGNNKQETRIQDSVLMKDVFEPLVVDAVNNDETPDWEVLKTKVSAGHDAAFTERFICKAKIFYFYGRDWSEFNAALIHYTETYEDKNDARLMNKNARMILDHSADRKQLEVALSWSKQAVVKEPANADYKKTQDALAEKLAAK
jgi:hypothetical protein